jgi:alkylation response protein AidB-like acyl-CoA dehydrogenase
MSANDTLAGVEAARQRARDVLAEFLPPGFAGAGSLPDDEHREFRRDWRRKLAETRLLAWAWPEEYGGGGGTHLEEAAIHEECFRAGAPMWAQNDAFSIQMLGNTLLRRGTEEQRRHFLPRILSGEDTWCQGYSEPDAGSDLAALRCRAVLDGDQWVINGQKIWTSDAHNANWIFALVRTDPSGPKHSGISFMLIPLDQPGVEVRGLRSIAGSTEFNEVFFTDARTAEENVVGEVDQGWSVAMTLIGFERGAEAGLLYIQFREELDRLVALARDRGRLADPLIRQRIVQAHARVETLRYLGLKAMNSLAAGNEPGVGAALTKLHWSEHHILLTELALDILDGEALVPVGRPSRNPNRADEPGAPNSPAGWVDVYLKSRAGTIYAGTSEIQRNTIATRILGLPK